MWKKVALFAFLAFARCTPVPENGVAENIVGAVSECIEKDTSLCLKEKALKFTEKLAISKDFNLFEGMSLVNIGSARSARSYEALAEDPKTRESQIEERIANNVGDFLDNHILQLRLSDNTPDNESRSLDDESRAKKNKKKIKQLLPLLLILKLKLAALIPLFLGIIAFVAVKAIFIGKIAFAMQAFNLIRKLLSKGGQGGSGGWASGGYSSGHHHEEHPGYSYEPAQGWSRKANDAQSLAYSAHL